MHNLDALELNLDQLTKNVTNDDSKDNIDTIKLLCQNPACTHHLSTRFQILADILVFLKNNASQLSFTKSQYQKINGLFQKGAFKIVTISDIFNRTRIFNFHFVDLIKIKKTAIVFEI